jgi:hypothetical protein
LEEKNPALLKIAMKPGMVVHAYNSSTQESETGRWKVQG